MSYYCCSEAMICALIGVLSHEGKTIEWRLLIDSLKNSLRVVLFHNGDRFSSVPVAYTTDMKVIYENIVGKH